MEEQQTSWFEEIYKWTHESIGISSVTMGKIIGSLLTIVVILLLRYLILKMVSRRTDDAKVLYQWRKSLSYASTFLVILLVGRTWLQGIDSLSTYLGLFSAGIAIALKDLLVNFAGWVFIVWRKPFEVGDRVEVDGIRGDVIDLRIFQFSMLEVGNWVHAEQSTGRIYHVPNGRLFNAPLANYSRGFPYIWDELGVLVTFESNWKEAEAILKEIVNEVTGPFAQEAQRALKAAANRYMIAYHHVTPIVYVSVEDSGVLFTMRFLCGVRQRRGTAEHLWKRVLDAFAERDDIDFAYPTRRYYDNSVEGKPGARAEK